MRSSALSMVRDSLRARGRRGCKLLLLTVLIGVPSQLTAQQIEISETAGCSGCRLEFERIALIGAVDGDGALVGQPTSVVQDSRGNYYTTFFQDRTQILVFNREGRFLQRIGRSGRGPGEFNFITFIAVGRADSLYVFDVGNARLTVLSPTYVVARSAPINGQFFGAVFLPTGRFVVNAHTVGPNRTGQPLQTLGLDGGVHSVYGATNPDFRPQVPYSVMRTIGRSSDSSVWSGYKTRYVLEEWRASGEQVRVLSRTVPWFKGYEQRSPSTREQPAEPWFMALRQDNKGLLWTAISVPGENWSTLWRDLGFDARRGVASDQRMFDTIIEVIEPNQRQVVVSQRVPQHLLGFLNDSTAYGYQVDADEIPHIEIWKIRLLRGNPGR